jgi:hypothetical protein
MRPATTRRSGGSIRVVFEALEQDRSLRDSLPRKFAREFEILRAAHDEQERVPSAINLAPDRARSPHPTRDLTLGRDRAR